MTAPVVTGHKGDAPQPLDTLGDLRDSPEQKDHGLRQTLRLNLSKTSWVEGREEPALRSSPSCGSTCMMGYPIISLCKNSRHWKRQ